VRYADADAMGVAYNSVYLVWFEVGRTEWMRARGIPYREVESRGLALPVTEASLRIRRGARYDDLIAIETTLQEVRSRRVVFAYRILFESRSLAEGTTFHVAVDSASGKTVRLPPWLAEILGVAPVDGAS
jgi:acyl-CoA thioester hydrolase